MEAAPYWLAHEHAGLNFSGGGGVDVSMNSNLMGLMLAVATLGAQVARADWNSHGAMPVQPPAPCGPRPTMAPNGQSFQQGRYELQNRQVWVPGQPQQVWVAGSCEQGGGYGGHHHRRWRSCQPGAWRTVYSEGHYETTQQWVWVASVPPPNPYGGAYGGSYGSSYSYQQTSGSSSFSVTVY